MFVSWSPFQWLLHLSLPLPQTLVMVAGEVRREQCRLIWVLMCRAVLKFENDFAQGQRYALSCM